MNSPQQLIHSITLVYAPPTCVNTTALRAESRYSVTVSC
nr:MAG TPA: hypothetical protein [Caudoviricetes sp.]